MSMMMIAAATKLISMKHFDTDVWLEGKACSEGLVAAVLVFPAAVISPSSLSFPSLSSCSLP